MSHSLSYSQSRPYIQFWVDDLEKQVTQNWDSVDVLRDIFKELERRKRKKAKRLAERISSRLDELNTNQVSEVEDLAPTINQSMREWEDIRWMELIPDSQGLKVPYLRLEKAERWITLNELEMLANHFLAGCPNIDSVVKKFVLYEQRCHRRIKSDRRYQVPSQGFAEIKISPLLQELLRIQTIRFVQEGVDPPGVYLKFAFSFNSAVGVVKINSDLRTIEGFHNWHTNLEFQFVVEGLCFAYYRDLVVPNEGLTQVAQRKTKPDLNQALSHSKSRSLPRSYAFKYTNENLKLSSDIDSWHQIQERNAHRVTGHKRWIYEGFEADEEKQAQSLRAMGIRLPLGYTWVIEHNRGHSQTIGLSDLQERMIFSSPRNATKEIEALLFHN